MQREILVSETQNPNFMICHPIDSSDQRKTDNKPWNKQTNKQKNQDSSFLRSTIFMCRDNCQFPLTMFCFLFN